MNRLPITDFSDTTRIEHLEKTIRDLTYAAGGYCEVGGVRWDASDGEDAYRRAEALLRRREAMFNEGLYELAFFDPDRDWTHVMVIEKFLVKKGIFRDKTRFRAGFFRRKDDGDQLLGYLVGKGIPDLGTRVLKTIGGGFSDPLMDDQSSLLAMSSR